MDIEAEVHMGVARKGLRVLIVDDDHDIRALVRMLTEGWGFEVVAEARDGAEAVEELTANPADFVILDYMMPGHSGEETAPLLRHLVPHTQIIAFSAILEEKPAWADAYLNKAYITALGPLLERLSAP